MGRYSTGAAGRPSSLDTNLLEKVSKTGRESMRMCSLFPTCVGLTLARNDLKLRFPSVETSLIKTSDNLPTVNLEAKIKIVSKIPCAFGRCTYVSKIQGWSITK